MALFSNFKDNFYNRIKDDISVFDCEEFNMLKVVLDGLYVDYANKGKVRSHVFYPLFFYESFLLLKNSFIKIKFGQKTRVFDKLEYSETLVVDVARVINLPNGKMKSLYFDNIVKSLDRTKTFIVSEKAAKIDCDVFLSDLENRFKYQKLNLTEKKLRSELISCFNKIKHLEVFSKTELVNIQFAIYNFFNQYRVWSRFLANFNNIKHSIFVCHYHKEGLMLALRRKKVKCIELQHGLIAKEDIFYIFPNSIDGYQSKMLFADKILVYGRYWLNVLLKGNEYKAEQISIIGNYLYNDFSSFEIKEKEVLKFKENNKKLILVTTQTSMQSYYIDYVKFLKKNIEDRNINAVIIIKPHPSESIALYKNEFINSGIVSVSDIPIQILFKYTDVHISIYSTTLYDALKYKLTNFSLMVNDFIDYTKGIVDNNIALPLELNQNPLDLITTKNDSKEQFDTTNFFSLYNQKALLGELIK